MKRSLFAFGMVMVALTARSGQYFQDFTTENVGSISYSDGSTINGIEFGGTSSIGVRDSTYKELQLTANGTSETHASWMLPDLDPGSAVYAFSARWNLEMNRSLTNAADGFSFNFGQLADLEVGNVGYAQEAGYPTGICFSVQTYQSNSPGFYLRANGSTLAALAYDPLIRWGLTNSARHYFEVDWHFQAGMTVRMDGQTIFSNVVMTGFAPLAGDRFVWAARAAASPGSASQEVRLDNVVVVTAGNLVQLPLTSPYYKSGEYTNANQTADKAFDGIVATKWLTLSNAGYVGATTVSGPQRALVYSLTSAEDIQGRDPSLWTLEGSTNGGTSWTVCGQGGGYFTNRNERCSWLATNANTFNAFRLNISTNRGAAQIQLSELQLYGFVEYLPLTISPNGDNVILQWENVPGFHVEFRTNLSVGDWVSNTTTPTLSGSINLVTNPVDSPTKFFRLRKP